MSDIQERRGPGRPPNAERAQETKVVRRRRQGMGPERNLKLTIPNKDPDYEYRWVNDRPGRVDQLTKLDDWDIAPEMNGPGLGTVGERTVDKTTGERGVLLRKRKEFYDEDQAEKEKQLKARDDTMRRGPLPGPSGAGGAEQDKTYVPNGRNIVGGR